MANIRLDGGAIPQPDPRRTGEAARNQAAQKSGDAPVGSRTVEQGLSPDRVELSPDAQQLSSSEAVPKGEVSPDRLKQVGGRIAKGFYSSTDVQSVIADKIKGDLGIG